MLLKPLDPIGPNLAALLAPGVVLIPGCQRHLLLPFPIVFDCLGQLAKLIVGKRIAWAEDLMQPDIFGVGVMTLLAGHSPHAIDVRADGNPLDVHPTLRSLAARRAHKAILIHTRCRVRRLIGRYRLANYPAQNIIRVLDFDIVVIAIEQRLANEDRILQRDHLADMARLAGLGIEIAMIKTSHLLLGH
ncbi:hypothetical protein D3C81_1051290 [compost metagenome]